MSLDGKLIKCKRFWIEFFFIFFFGYIPELDFIDSMINLKLSYLNKKKKSFPKLLISFQQDQRLTIYKVASCEHGWYINKTNNQLTFLLWKKCNLSHFTTFLFYNNSYNLAIYNSKAPKRTWKTLTQCFNCFLFLVQHWN